MPTWWPPSSESLFINHTCYVHNTLHCLSLTWLSVPLTMRDASLLSLVDSEVLTNSIYLYLQANGTSPVFRKRSKSYVASLRLKSWGHEMKAFLNVNKQITLSAQVFSLPITVHKGERPIESSEYYHWPELSSHKSYSKLSKQKEELHMFARHQTNRSHWAAKLTFNFWIRPRKSLKMQGFCA